MAYGAEPAGAFAHTIYVRPSPDLVGRSWQWPASWHEAFEHAMARLGLAVATCLLEGLPLSERAISRQLPTDCIDFRIARRGTSIYIAVSEFAGPDVPGPDGGCQQPRPTDGLVLGLRGAGRSFHLVVFQGHMPAIPASNFRPSGTSGQTLIYPRSDAQGARNYLVPNSECAMRLLRSGAEGHAGFNSGASPKARGTAALVPGTLLCTPLAYARRTQSRCEMRREILHHHGVSALQDRQTEMAGGGGPIGLDGKACCDCHVQTRWSSFQSSRSQYFQ